MAPQIFKHLLEQSEPSRFDIESPSNSPAGNNALCAEVLITLFRQGNGGLENPGAACHWDHKQRS